MADDLARVDRKFASVFSAGPTADASAAPAYAPDGAGAPAPPPAQPKKSSRDRRPANHVNGHELPDRFSS